MEPAKKDKRKIWQVQEHDTGYGRAVITGQTRNVPALSRKEAKEIYTVQYKKYPTTTLTATIISHDMREWAGDAVSTQKGQ
jgi:hypothetical protein